MKAFGDNLNRDFITENSFQKLDDFHNSKGNDRKITRTLSEFLHILTITRVTRERLYERLERRDGSRFIDIFDSCLYTSAQISVITLQPR